MVAPPRRTPARPRQRINYFSFEDLGRKDLFTGLTLWVVIELVSFLLLPSMMGIDFGDRLGAWFTLSIPLGIGGAFLLSSSSRFMAINNERSSGTNKSVFAVLGLFAGWFGIAGIVFPFVMVAGEFLSKVLMK